MISISDTYDICIIGGGLIGSAAAKYSSKLGARACLVAAPEPNREDYADHDIFGAHYDEARITRRLDNNPFWSHIASRSIDRYRSIERESGVSFFNECGYLCLTDAGSPCLKDNQRVANEHNIKVKFYKSHELRPAFPYLKTFPQMEALMETKDAGMINPRRLIQAQNDIFQKNGGKMISDVATRVSELEEITSEGEKMFRIETKSHGQIKAKKVLLCTGAFIEHGHLLPPGVNLELFRRASTAARLLLTEHMVKDFENMPSLYISSDRTFEHRSDRSRLEIYILPPVKYPDGHWYLKLGYSDHEIDPKCKTAADVSKWYKTDNSRVGKLLEKETTSLIVGLKPETIITDTCVTLGTPSGYPYLDEIKKNWFIATAGQGWAAKSSDEIGHIISTLAVSGKWDCPFPREWFKAQQFRRAKI